MKEENVKINEENVKINEEKVSKCLKCEHENESPFHICPKCGFNILEYRKKVIGI